MDDSRSRRRRLNNRKNGVSKLILKRIYRHTSRVIFVFGRFVKRSCSSVLYPNFNLFIVLMDQPLKTIESVEEMRLEE